MKVGILSDSHDNLPMIEAALAAFGEAGAEVIVHAGDFVAPFAVKKLLSAGLPVYGVFGNCDGERRIVSGLLPGTVPGVRRETLGGRVLVMVHSLERLKEKDREGAEVIVCGHTHRAEISGRKPLIINPGECGGWVNGRPTAAVLDTEMMKAQIIELGR